jgi:hypothetical protein
MGYGAEGMKYRFQWNFPVFFSPHDPDKLYACSNHLHVSYDEGQSWELISPDLTRNDSVKLVSSGGPITKDNTGVEYYCTIFAAVESTHEAGVIWTGSDDGMLHLTRDGGDNWTNVTPKIMPEWTMINSLEIDPFNPGGLYVAATSYKSGDYQPYLFKTKDYGASWEKITDGIAKDHFTRVVRADPDRKGLLYCGTESGIYLSYDNGLSWKPWQLNLPQVPITDLTLKNKNLIAATQGRSFWIIDDLTPLHQLNKDIEKSTFFLYNPLPSYRIGGYQNKEIKTSGRNHPGGVLINFYLKNEPDTTTSIQLKIMDTKDQMIHEFSNQAKDKKDQLSLKKGFNQFSWNMRYPDAEGFDGLIMWAAGTQGPVALPGSYKVRLIYNNDSLQSDFSIIKDPRSDVSLEQLKEQFDFLIEVRNKVSETSEAILKIRKARAQINELTSKLSNDSIYDPIREFSDSINTLITKVEETLYQTKNQSRQDPLNFPIKLNNKLAHLMMLTSIGDYQPTQQAFEFKQEVTESINKALADLNEILETQIPAFNKMVKETDIDAIILD